jgi:hypothetical protein
MGDAFVPCTSAGAEVKSNMGKRTWDFFVAHASADRELAEGLYELLSPQFRVFLDSRSLVPGDDWDQAIAKAQTESAISLILVSSNTENAYYQREEVASAIDMARNDRDQHRVVPIYVGGREAVANNLPYGLRLKHGISLIAPDGLPEIAEQLKKNLRSSLAMPPAEIVIRHKNRLSIGRALRLLPKAEFDPQGFLGRAERKYVFIGDYDEQRNRTARQILSNLGVGDSFERIDNSNVEWIALTFDIGELNAHKLDLKPATWKAAFRILSDPKRIGCFQASEEEREKLGIRPRDYYSADQMYWYERLTTPERRNTRQSQDYYIQEVLGIRNLCFDGSGITDSSSVPSRIFFITNCPVAHISYSMQELGTPDDQIALD